MQQIKWTNVHGWIMSEWPIITYESQMDQMTNKGPKINALMQA